MSWYLEKQLARAEYQERVRNAVADARFREARAVHSGQRRKHYAALVAQLKGLRQRMRRVPA